MNEDIVEVMKKLPRQNLINIMWDAMDSMEENTKRKHRRSKSYYIAEAMGAKTVGEEYTLPTLTYIKKVTE